MKTTKITANILASVLRLAVISQWCERASWWQQATTSYTHRPSRLMSLVLPVITALLICSVTLMETCHDADGAVLGRLRGIAYTTSLIVRDCVQL